MTDAQVQPDNAEFDAVPAHSGKGGSVPRRNPSTDSDTATASKGHRLVPLLVWLGVLLTLLLIPLRIISYGYLPQDDALSHAAKAVSGRAWSDVVVMQDKFQTDHNPGWHWLLGLAHRAAGIDTEGLVTLSICALALLVFLPPTGWLRYPEAWAASLLASQVMFPDLIYRTFLARPFAVSVATTIAILLLWRKRESEKPPYWLLGISTLLFALATWIHGSWYLFALLVAAFALAGQWRSSIWLAGSWLVGSACAALLTGHPFAFLGKAINVGINSFGHHEIQNALVTEFGPIDGDYSTLLFAFILLTIRALSGHWSWKAVNNPIFILVILGWILGWRVKLFWLDWSLPALALWTALELQEHFARHLNLTSFRRLTIAAGLCAALLFGLTSDVKSRWTRNLANEYLSQTDPEMAPWLPEDGGIIYSSDTRVFYDTFFKNPNANWKYILGFEPNFMPPDDLRIYRKVQRNYGAVNAHEDWVPKMRPQDRMIVLTSSQYPPNISGLEWNYVAREYWIGRLPGKTSASSPSPK